MSEKIYQISSEQVGVVSFSEPWFLAHVEVEGVEPFQIFYPSLDEGIKRFAPFFEEHVINVWKKSGEEGERKIQELKEYVIKEWYDPGVETMRKAMYETYGYPEFKDKTGKELIEDGYDFLAITIGHIAIRYNKFNFYFKDLHISARIVDKFLAVDFWTKAKKDALDELANTVLK
ncbi:hypothetical protein SCORR_v1c03100 [Spiroplasma corruscae]|uniref:Uncharacterized protein n=1 Tax=Spiroplasma corruscae TaxID=216934 RepID=A0A222EP53_9MOLU|nr:hypothetical protein [Spiroplasma corruscae]ASP28084.1 hypothetical protein SCORR_v1c03100 [Spiroplasma corruscae]